ncbi:hypothetical protein A2U01_0066276, partial [Trifolium medium]|nr:hypothetical protein [Trifolium medium]
MVVPLGKEVLAKPSLFGPSTARSNHMAWVHDQSVHASSYDMSRVQVDSFVGTYLVDDAGVCMMQLLWEVWDLNSIGFFILFLGETVCRLLR